MNIQHLLSRVVVLGLLIGSPVLRAADPAPAAGALPAPLPPAQFAQTVAMIDMLEIQLGEIAMKNSSNKEVQMLGRCMKLQHTLISERLAKVAKAQGISLPTSLDAKHAAIVKKLSGLKGTAFDNAYVPAMVAGHTKALAMFRAQERGGTNAKVRGFARKNTPLIASHLEMSKHVLADLQKGGH